MASNDREQALKARETADRIAMRCIAGLARKSLDAGLLCPHCGQAVGAAEVMELEDVRALGALRGMVKDRLEEDRTLIERAEVYLQIQNLRRRFSDRLAEVAHVLAPRLLKRKPQDVESLLAAELSRVVSELMPMPVEPHNEGSTDGRPPV